MSKKDTLPVGIITGAHGINGEVKLRPYSNLDGVVLKNFFIAGKDGPFTALKTRPNKKEILVFIDGINTREDAERLKGLEVLVQRKGLPKLKPGEYYFADLIGLEVSTREGTGLGKVKEVFSTGGNDVIEVNGRFGDILIPVIEDSGIEVDLKAGSLRVHLLDGLLPEGLAEKKK
ncbi:MAG: ribosome maturation factor RimM [Deltaproteobacteria bacterium]